MSRYFKDDYDWEDFISDREGGVIDFTIDKVIDLLNQQDEKIKELKQELANEHEKLVLTANDELQKLKSQLEEQKNINKKLNLENQKLFEENISQSYDIEKCVKVAKEQIDKTFNAECELSIVKTNQNQLAIEELEKIKSLQHKTLYYDNKENSIFDICIDDYIDDRIIKLKQVKILYSHKKSNK